MHKPLVITGGVTSGGTILAAIGCGQNIAAVVLDLLGKRAAGAVSANECLGLPPEGLALALCIGVFLVAVAYAEDVFSWISRTMNPTNK